MRLGRLVGGALVFVPLLLICASRLHAQRGATPHGVTQEVNRCLTVVRVAASRRRFRQDNRIPVKAASAAGTDTGAAFAPVGIPAKTA